MHSDKQNVHSFLEQFNLINSYANYFLIFLCPLILTFVISLLIIDEIYTINKAVLEVAALIILGIYFLISTLKFATNRDKYFLWVSCMLLTLLIREIHPPGSSLGVYIGILILLYVAHRNFENFSDYFLNKKLINFTATGFFTYFIAVTIDQRFWKIIPGEEIVHVPLEESLEVIGHLLIGYGLVFMSQKRKS